MFDWTSKAAYRRQVAELEKRLKKSESDLADERTKVKHLHDNLDKRNDEVKRLINEGEERKVVAGNIINDQRKKIRNLEKQIADLKVALSEAKPRYYRGKNGRFTKKTAEPQQQ